MSNIIIKILITGVFYALLMFLSTNLLGLFVRGFFISPELEKLKKDSHEFIKQEIEKYEHARNWVNFITLILIIVYLYLLFYFWNIGVMTVGILLMIARFPDLLWEIRTGRKITLDSIPRNKLNFIITSIYWIGFPLLYYFLFY